MKRSNRLVLLVGVFLAVVAFVGILLLVRSPQGQVAEAPPTTGPVVVAAADIPLSSRIREDQVTTTTVPLDAISAGAFKDPSQVIGQIVRQPVAKGAQITSAILGTNTTGTVTNITTPAGLRSIAVQVDQITGVGTAIKTGDFVDMIVGMTGAEFPIVGTTPGTPGVAVVAGLAGTNSTKVLLQGLQVVGTLLPPVAARRGGTGTVRRRAARRPAGRRSRSTVSRRSSSWPAAPSRSRRSSSPRWVPIRRRRSRWCFALRTTSSIRPRAPRLRLPTSRRPASSSRRLSTHTASCRLTSSCQRASSPADRRPAQPVAILPDTGRSAARYLIDTPTSNGTNQSTMADQIRVLVVDDTGNARPPSSIGRIRRSAYAFRTSNTRSGVRSTRRSSATAGASSTRSTAGFLSSYQIGNPRCPRTSSDSPVPSSGNRSWQTSASPARRNHCSRGADA